MPVSSIQVSHEPSPRRSSARRWLVLLASVCTWAVAGAAVPTTAVADVRSDQWYLDVMQAEEMWKVSTGEGVKVAVIDSGIDPSTPSLRGQVLEGKDVSGLSGDATDDYDGHGTSMAELIAGTGEGGGIRGLAPASKIIPVRTNLSSSGKSEKFTSDKALRAAADSDAKIINMSFGGPAYSSAMKKAVDYAVGKGKLLFAGTGNNGDEENGLGYPASYAGVVGVGAVDEQARVAKFSQNGLSTDLAAPGVDVPSWCDKSLAKYCTTSRGTSQATAIASASAALIWAEHPDWTANQVLRVLVDTAGSKGKDGTTSKYIGYGVVRPRLNLLEGKGDPGPAGRNPIEGTDKEPSGQPSASSSPEGEGSDADGKNNSKTDTEKVGKASSASDDDSDLWIYLGAGAAVAVGLVIAFTLVRRRTR